MHKHTIRTACGVLRHISISINRANTFPRGRNRFKLLRALIAGCLLTSSMGALAIKPGDFNLADYKGKVVYLDFWASWCGPCKFSFPYMEYLANTFPSKDLVVIADNLDHSKASAQAFLKQINNQIPIIYDQKGVLATRFNVSDMPTAVLIDRDGKVRYIHKGFFKDKEDDYTSQVLELIKENRK